MSDKEAMRIIKCFIWAESEGSTPENVIDAAAHIEARLGQLQDLEAEPKAITLDMVNKAGKPKTISIQEELERR